MRFLGGFLKFLAILVMIVATVACTANAVYQGRDDVIFDMVLIWLLTVLPSLIVLGMGSAMTQVAKLRKRVEQLEARLYALQAAPAYYPPVYQAPVYQPPVEQPQPEIPQAEQNPEAGVAEAAQPEIPAPVYQPPVAAQIPAVPAAPAKRSKAWIAIVAAVLVVVIAVVAVIAVTSRDDQRGPSYLDEDDDPMQTEEGDEDEGATEEADCPMTIVGICVDDSFVPDDGSSLKLVYLFYTLTAQDSNLSIDSKYTTMYIGDNAYESDHFADVAAACKFTPNYYYGSYIRDVYVGETKNVVATFYIPAAELEGSKEVRFEDHQIPGIESVVTNTDSFFHYGSAEDIAYNMDSEGYEQIMYLREPADEATAQLVRSQLNNYYWSFYVNNLSYRLEFWAPNNFSVTTSFGTQSGTYTVRNGFIFCTYPSNGYTVEIPYTLVDGNLELDTIAGFDVMG